MRATTMGATGRPARERPARSGATDRGPGEARRAPAEGRPLVPGERFPTFDDRAGQRFNRFAAQKGLRWTSSLRSVRLCGTARSDGGEVEVRARDGVAGVAGVHRCGNAKVCPVCASRVAAERSAQVRSALTRARELGLCAFFLTFTARHQGGDRLADLWDGLMSAWTYTTGKGPWTRGDAASVGFCGFVRATEATVGRPWLGGAGWHLHFHVLFVCDPSSASFDIRAFPQFAELGWTDDEWVREMWMLDQIAQSLGPRWLKGLERAGMSADPRYAVDARRVDDTDAVADYISKSTYGQGWEDTKRNVERSAIAGEMGMGMFKAAARESRANRAHGQQSRIAQKQCNTSVFDLLEEVVSRESLHCFQLATTLDERGGWGSVPLVATFSQDGRGVTATLQFAPPAVEGGAVVCSSEPVSVADWAHAMWIEWEQGSLGREMIRWSNRAKPSARYPNLTVLQEIWNQVLDARGEWRSEEAICDDEFGDSDDTLVVIPADAWNALVWSDPALRTALLEVAASGRREAVVSLLVGMEVPFTPGGG